MGLPILMDWKKNSYNSILIIFEWLIKIVYYKLIKVIINTLGLVKIIINIMIRHYNFLDLIIINQRFFFILKF